MDFRDNPIITLSKSFAFAKNVKEFRLQQIGEGVLTLFNEPMHKNRFS